MSAVSKNVTPCSIAASTTARVPSRSTRRPKLLQPRPTTDPSSPESPRARVGSPAINAVYSRADWGATLPVMCRNIRTLYNFDPPASDEEVRAAALQYVRKISGFSKPSRANEEAFARAIDAVSAASEELL